MDKTLIIEKIDQRIEELKEVQDKMEFTRKDIEFTIALHRRSELQDLRNWILITT